MSKTIVFAQPVVVQLILNAGDQEDWSPSAPYYVKRIQVITDASATCSLLIGDNSVDIPPGRTVMLPYDVGRLYPLIQLISTGGTSWVNTWS